MKDYVYDIDKYGNPKVYKNHQAVSILLAKLFMMNPGDDELHPDMGIGLVKNYRYAYMEDFAELQLNAQKQIETYLPLLQNVSVDVLKNPEQHEIKIVIKTSDTVYALMTDNEDLKIVDL